ncbi:penicillin-binding protein 1C, partial [Myxococcota bacterium]|nr:penicillin-binding protein 1C [Myxococcota bacterium]
PLAVARAFRQNLRAGRVESGASTITMQVVRLARAPRPRTLGEKLVEICAALVLEWHYDKDEILALYAAHAPLGGNVVGLEAAAWRYFGREPERLSWAESALVAVLANRPAALHPGRNREALRAKRDALLERLHTAGELDALELSLALAEPIPDRPRALPRLAPHLLDRLSAEAAPETARFETTLDAELQQRSVELVSLHARALAQQQIRNAAAVILRNDPFEVVAWVGNSHVEPDPEHGRMLDLVERPRSTGSVLKPFLYAAMIGTGELLPDQLVADVPTHIGGFVPENYDRQFRGAVSARLALARSLNVPAVRLLRQHGVARFHEDLRSLGMTSLVRQPDDYGLTLVLGGAEGTLGDLTAMYARLAQLATTGSAVLERPAILRASSARDGGLDDRDGLKSQHRMRRSTAPAGIDAASAWLTLDALTEVTRPDSHGGWQTFRSARPVAWKTGTSYGLRDAWAIGTTPEYTIGVWVGNADGEGRAGLSGVSTAAPLLFDLLEILPASRGAGFFREPREKMKPVRTCKDDGHLANDLCEARIQWIPRRSRPARTTPYHARIFVDEASGQRADSRCRPVHALRLRPWFVLPPAMAHYYRRQDPAYREPPSWHPDCVATLAASEGGPIALLYPAVSTELYVPIELDGTRGRTVFEAIHRDPEATLHWHLDERFVESTRTFHQLALAPASGDHRLVLVDDAGHRLERRFRVLERDRRVASRSDSRTTPVASLAAQPIRTEVAHR